MLRVWVGDRPVGILDRHGERGTTFVYGEGVDERDLVSMTMPRRTASWDTRFGLVPAFDQNLPEGALRERLANTFGKAFGKFDELALLSLVGRSQIGRVRLTAMDGTPGSDLPFQSIQEILDARRGGDLLDYLMEKYATHSGLSGVQPKTMVRDDRERASTSLRGATHIVKMWNADEFPELAANEYFCLEAARRMGLEVPKFELSDSGDAIVIERFDHVDGQYIGFEDFCVLNAHASKEKYVGGYETKLFGRLRGNLAIADRASDMRKAFRLFVLNCAVRNGDAHLKNWGMTYRDSTKAPRLAPVYDIITTTAYIAGDKMALTLDGRTNWPLHKQLMKLGQTRIDMSRAEVDATCELVADTLADVAVELSGHFRSSTAPEIGERMVGSWQDGVRTSLGLVRDYVPGSCPVPG